MSYRVEPATVIPKSTKLSEAVFQLLRKHIYEKTGIFFADNKKYLLESRISHRLLALGIPDFDSYYRMLSNGEGPVELPQLINTVTINETFFFRNDIQLAEVESTIMPELIKRRMEEKTDKIRVWSAACSSGEEPYSLAMIIRDKFMPRFPFMKFEIVGSDINTQVLDAARKGIYKDYAVRTVPDEYMAKYFTQKEGRFFLDHEIKKMVDFRQVNLFDRSAMRAIRGFDLIFASNVLIYFDFNSKQTVLSSVYDCTSKGGYLFVGYSETLYGLTQAFKPVHIEKAIAYRKE